MTARRMWDAAKHPHGVHGRWASKGGGIRKVATAVGRTPGGASDLHQLARRGKRDLYGVARSTTRMHASPAAKAKRVHTASVTTWGPGIWGGKDARIRRSYQTGSLGPVQPHPKGGTYRPVVKAAGFEPTGYKPMPKGSTFAALQKSKRKTPGGYSGKHRA